MALRCPRCSRVAPDGAAFCFADGAPITGAVADPARRRFPSPFVFPSGKACHTFDELVLACGDDWTTARELLKDGTFAGFLGNVGRADLARAARQAAADGDPDGALDGLLRRLPSNQFKPPKLTAEPGQVNLGELRPGKDVLLTLHLENAGMGLLTGSVAASGAWLFVGGTDAPARKRVFRFLHEAEVPVHVKGNQLRASSKPTEGSLVVETNGGTVTVPVRFSVPIAAFPAGVLGGATTPRQVAEKAKASPKEAGELFASGAVARWYAVNGWDYPVREPAATGVAAVQQFFEALGLTKPPKVVLDRNEVELEGAVGGPATATVELASDDKKPVWASVVCEAEWLDVRSVALDGRRASIKLGTTRVPERHGETLKAKVVLITNGRERHVVTVTLPVPLEEARDEPRPARRRVSEEAEGPRARGRASTLTLVALPVLLLGVGISVTLARDLTAFFGKPGGVGGDDGLSALPQALRIAYHDGPHEVTLAVGGGVKPGGAGGRNERPATWEPSMRFGLVAYDREGTRKKLTFEEMGLTNNAVVRLDGGEWLFGERPFRLRDGSTAGDWPGRWLERGGKPDRPMRDGRRSTWVYDREKVEVTQTVGLLAGEQSDRIDTCLVLYRITNRDTRPHRVGLRFLLDTYIGANDGVPFLIPGYPQLCTTWADFNTPKLVPDFLQACERDDLARPGTVVQLRLRVNGLEPPSRVTLGAWPNPALGGLCKQEKTLWDVPLFPIRSAVGNDSAVTMYWPERDVEAGGYREVGFAYGLGSVTAADGGGRLALTVGGNFTPRGEFTLTAYVRDPAPGQSLKLTLPPGFELVGVPATMAVPAAAEGRISPVTWRVRAGATPGAYSLRVDASTGVSQAQPVRIAARGLFGG